MVLALKNLILLHHHAELILQILEPPDPFIIYNWPIDVNWHFDFNRYLHLNFNLFLYWSIHVYRLFHKYRLINYDWIFVNWPLDEDLFLDYLRYFYLFDDDLWNFLLYLNILRHLNYPFHDSLRTRNIFRNLYLDLNRPLDY